MSMWITISSLTEEEVQNRIRLAAWTPISRLVPKPDTVIMLPYSQFNKPDDCFFDKERCHSLSSYLVTRFNIRDDVYYLGRVRFILNIIENDLKNIKRGKLIKYLPVSGYKDYFNSGAKELLDYKTLYPYCFDPLVKYLEIIRNDLHKQIHQGKRDNYIIVEYSS